LGLKILASEEGNGFVPVFSLPTFVVKELLC